MIEMEVKMRRWRRRWGQGQQVPGRVSSGKKSRFPRNTWGSPIRLLQDHTLSGNRWCMNMIEYVRSGKSVALFQRRDWCRVCCLKSFAEQNQSLSQKVQKRGLTEPHVENTLPRFQGWAWWWRGCARTRRPSPGCPPRSGGCWGGRPEEALGEGGEPRGEGKSFWSAFFVCKCFVCVGLICKSQKNIWSSQHQIVSETEWRRLEMFVGVLTLSEGPSQHFCFKVFQKFCTIIHCLVASHGESTTIHGPCNAGTITFTKRSVL